MFYEDVRRLRNIYKNAVEDAISEVAPELLLEISALALRCSSRWLAAEESYVWAVASDTWGKSGRFENYLQNMLCGTSFDLDDRIEILQKETVEIHITLFHIEELLVDIGKLQADENARNSLAIARSSSLIGATLRRTESTGGLKTKNWFTVVYQSREVVSKALGFKLQLPDSHKGKRAISQMTQHWSTRIFVGQVLEALSKPRPGSFFDFHGPFWSRFQFENPFFSMRISSSNFGSLDPHYPFWKHRAFRGATYALSVGFGIFAIFFVKKLSSETLKAAFSSVRTWFMSHLTEPAHNMIDELFFNKAHKAMDIEHVSDARASLGVMLDSYRKDHGIGPPTANRFDMSDISREYEKAIRTPLREAIQGDLIRLALIQAQALKAETLQLAHEVDTVVVENHFNSQVLATLPAVGVMSLMIGGFQRSWRWLNDESNSVDTAKIEIKNTLWEIQHLLIREDDGPALFSYLTNDDRGSETGGSEHWVTTGTEPPVRKYTSGSNNNEDDEDVLIPNQLFEEAVNFDPIIRYRRQLAGQLIKLVHHLINLLIRSRSVLFRNREHEWRAAMRDVACLFAREGWTAHARFQLAQCLAQELNNM